MGSFLFLSSLEKGWKICGKVKKTSSIIIMLTEITVVQLVATGIEWPI